MFTQRSVDVRVRDNQENRSSAFPKTPGKTASNGGAGKMPMTGKHANMGSSAAPTMSAFMTPAQPSRAPLGAKSTNVHLHRQFTSAKTGKRHSPVTAMRPPPKLQIALDPAPALAQPQAAASEPAAAAPKLEGIAGLRAALDRALETGVDVPEVEYAPPPVQELPFAEPENMYPMDWDAFEEIKAQRARNPLPVWRAPKDDPILRYMQTTEDDIPPFVMMNDDGTMPASAAASASIAGAKAAPRAKKVLGEKTNRATQTGAAKPSAAKKAASGAVLAKSTSSSTSVTSTGTSTTRPIRLGSFAAPTAAARAKTLDGKAGARPTTTRSVSGTTSLAGSSRSLALQRSLGGRSTSTLGASRKRTDADAVDERVRENELLFDDNLPPATLPEAPDLDPALFRFDIKLEDI